LAYKLRQQSLAWWGKVPEAEFFLQVETLQSAALFSVGLVPPNSVYFNFRQLCAKGAIYEVVFQKFHASRLVNYMLRYGWHRSGTKRR